MAGTTKGMSKIKQLLRLHLQNESNRKIATALGMNKETVNRYVLLARADSMSIEDLLRLEDPELEHRMNGGSPSYPDERFEHFKELLPRLEKEIKRPHVTLIKLWEEYKSDYLNGYSLTQFRYHFKQHSKAQKTGTVLRDLYIGGEKLFVDYAGDTMHYIHIETGEIIKVQVFVACLPATDYGYALAVPSQKSEDFIYALTRCLKAIGGVPKIIVPDNLKAAVTKTDRYEPDINHIMEDMANHYGCVVIPARSGKPKDKSLCEDQVKLVYQRVYADLRNEAFYSLEELNRAIAVRMQAHNRKRMQQYPYSREEHFLAVEKPALSPLPATDFEIRSYGSLKVGVNGCIYPGHDKHYYSVPHPYTGRQVKVIYTRTLVKIYDNEEGTCIATHTRDYKQGHYTLVREHLASHAQAYRDRSPDYYIGRAGRAMTELGEVIRSMFTAATVPPETFYRSCEGLLHLQQSTDPVLFRKACEIALLHQNYKYGFILKLVESKCSGWEETHPVTDVYPTPPANHLNIRGKEHFK
jgi:transposase